MFDVTIYILRPNSKPLDGDCPAFYSKTAALLYFNHLMPEADHVTVDEIEYKGGHLSGYILIKFCALKQLIGVLLKMLFVKSK